jgi:hypothetical protein
LAFQRGINHVGQRDFSRGQLLGPLLQHCNPVEFLEVRIRRQENGGELAQWVGPRTHDPNLPNPAIGALTQRRHESG